MVVLELGSWYVGTVEDAVRTGRADHTLEAPRGSFLGGPKDRQWGLVAKGIDGKSRLAA